ncbi:MAG TPA: DHA2 family efflux MFS transporter permease subunit, partial [Chitinophagaceae bacterium]|nr:DHA2 family efflux MFS transporter permease subunit [Chitinophagaceae bacterium]
MATEVLQQENPLTKSARILLIITAMTCALIELIDATVVNVALPELQAGIGVTRTEIAWATTAYSIGNIIIIPLSGMLSDLFGRKNYFTASVVVFTFCSLMCGLSTSLWELVLWRCLQGLGGGGLLATAQSIVIGAFPTEKINTANTIFGIGMIVGPIFGPLIGGFIIQHLTWHWIFFVNLPIGVVAAVLSWLYVSDLKGSTKPKRVDGWGIALLVIGIGTLEFVLEEGGIYDWFSSTSITILFITAILSLTAFVIHELRTEHPALNLRLLKNYNLSMGMLLMFIIGAVMIGSKFFFPLFVRVSLGWTAVQTGQVLASFAIGAVIGMVVFRKILDKGVPQKIVMLVGLALMAIQL